MEKFERYSGQTPKELKKVSGPGKGRIFAYTEALAARSDMVPVWGEDQQPPERVEPASGLSFPGSEIVPTLHEQLREKDKIIESMQQQIDGLVEDAQKDSQVIHDLKAKIAQYELGESELPSETPLEPPPHDGLSAEQRLKVLTAKTVEMIRNGDENDFTGQGKPRVERLEAWAGIAEVNANERDVAFDQAQALLKE